MGHVVKVISGGQTGVDRAALDAALKAGVPVGGWVPRGGWAEDMTRPPGLLARYPTLQETASDDIRERTRRNVQDASATLILPAPTPGRDRGTWLTLRTAQRLGRPCLAASLDDPQPVLDWLGKLPGNIILNVAGPRESHHPGIYRQTHNFLDKLLPQAAAKPASEPSHRLL